ncbi:kinase-like domain-containing protein [Phascolomyces articulosus]|uniref:Kinase-like domain-containing protein n=1 Tax=Phascolomyces articulosus TaxID=60185 RepID=A0AAD5K7I5_9FUNG|nr:kinase-like domain-containing protein [Phascolomyces articulosus]
MSSTTPIQLYGPQTVPKPTLSPISIQQAQQQQQQQNHQQQFIPPSPPATPQPKQEPTVAARSLMHHHLHPEFIGKYSLGEELGSGGFGFVVSATDRCTGVERAVKFIFRHKVPSHAWVRDPEIGPVPMEVYVLKHVRHDNIVNFVDFYQDDTFLYLVMELHGTQWSSNNNNNHGPVINNNTIETPSSPPHSPALSQASEESLMSSPGTPIDEYPPQLYQRRTSCDLFECIERHHNFNEDLAKKIFRQICECIGYLDTLGICHRDIKDENIVIDDQYRVKLIDFGSAVILPRHDGQQKTCYFGKFFGTVSFASPEILMCKPYRAEPAEIWALGVLLYTILFGEVPFTSPNMAIAGRFATPKIPVSYKCMHLLTFLLQRNPEKRPSIHQVLTHPWFHEN